MRKKFLKIFFWGFGLIIVATIAMMFILDAHHDKPLVVIFVVISFILITLLSVSLTIFGLSKPSKE